MLIRNPQFAIRNRQWLLLTLLLTSFALRLHALLQLPGFVDEGNHLLWAAEVWQGRVIYPFSTAKPLEIFYLALLMPFQNPLWVGRLGSVLLGLVTMSSLWALARRWGDGNTGLWAAMFYTVTPWTFFHERMAVADPLVAALAVTTAWVATRYAARPSAKRTIGLAICLVALPLAKLSAAPLMAMPVIVVALTKWRQLRRLWLPYVGAVVALAIILTPAALRYGVFGEITLRAEAAGRTSWIEAVARNTTDFADWAFAYGGASVGLALLGCGIVVARRSPLGWMALAGCLLGMCYIALPARAFPRYYLPALAFVSLLAAEAVKFALGLFAARWFRRTPVVVVFLVVVLPFATFASQAYRDPAALPLVEIDRFQHVTNWSSGYGIRQAAMFTADQIVRDSQPVVYAADLSTRVIARLYWPHGANSEIYVLWDAIAPKVIDVVASGRPAYLMVDTSRDIADFSGLAINPHELARFYRPLSSEPIIVYRLTAEPFAP